MNVLNKVSTCNSTEAAKEPSTKKANFRILTKEQVEAERSKAYSYVR